MCEWDINKLTPQGAFNQEGLRRLARNRRHVHRSMINVQADQDYLVYDRNGLPPCLPSDEWILHPQFMPEIRAMRLQDYAEEMRRQLICRMERSTPIPGEDIIHVNLADPEVTVDPDFLAFQLNESSELHEPSYTLCQKQRFEEILVKGVCSSQTPEIDDTFLKQPERRMCSLVLVSAGGGLGKSTQLMKMALDSYSGKSDILAHYELVLYVPITGISSRHKTFVDILLETEVFSKYYRTEPGEVERIQHFLDSFQNSNKVLILLDGCGKESIKNKVIGHIINGRKGYFPRSTVVLAGRPFWIKNLQCKRAADMKVDIAGITDDSVSKLFENILKSRENANQLHDICRQFFFDSTMLRTPLFAILSCYIFQAHKAKEIDVCQHSKPTTVTELINTILRVFLKIMPQKAFGEMEPFEVGFKRSPLLDSETGIPPNLRRFLHALAHMSFNGIKAGVHQFGKEELEAVYLTPEEVCAFGLLVCVSGDTRTGSCKDDIRFAFRSTMFQEYMAALYMSKDLSTVDELLVICEQNQRKKSDDMGYGSLSSIGSTEFNKPVKRTACVIRQLKRMFTPRPRETGSKYTLGKARTAEEHSMDEPCSLMGMKTKSCTDLTISRRRHLPQEHDECQCSGNSCDSEGTKCLYDMLNPFQNCVMFACGMNPEFTRKLLNTFGRYVQAKVCQNNSDKFDVGFEAALYCESSDSSLTTDFYDYFIHLRGRVGTNIQFPTPYDELVTSSLAFSLSHDQVLVLLHMWYRLDLKISQYSALIGGNIVRSGQTFLEMNDPCLFEVYLLHRYTFENITELIITGNYFPNFKHIARSFPKLKILKFDSVNMPSMKHYRFLDKDSSAMELDAGGCNNLEELVIRKCRASFPLLGHFQQFLRLSGGQNVRALQLIGLKCDSCADQLCDVLARFSRLESIHLRDSGLGYHDFTDSPKSVSSTLAKFAFLQYIDLSENNIGICISPLMHLLGQSKSRLTSLELSRCGIKSEQFVHFSEKLRFFPSLKHLGISENQVGENGQEIIKSLKHNRNIRSLNLNRCALKPDHFQAMAFYVTQLTSLESLDVSDNCLGSATEHFLTCLPRELVSINMRRCDIKMSYFRHGIRDSLVGLRRLQTLDLQENDLQDSLDDLVRGLQGSQVQYLNVRKCRLRPKDFCAAAAMLPKLRQLREIVIGFNTMCHGSEDSRAKLVKYLRQNETLVKVVSCGMHGEHFNQSQMSKLRNGGKVQVINFRRQ